MICAIHQPQTFPWLGYFAKLAEADIFVFLDDVQFKKNEWQNRNKIKTPQGWQWLTVPVLHHFGQDIAEVPINPATNWTHKHLQAIKSNYARAAYFKTIYDELVHLYEQPRSLLADFNMATLNWLLKTIGLTTTTVISSQLNYNPDRLPLTADDRLIRIIKYLRADTYLSGAGGRDYLQTELFPQHQIELHFQTFHHPQYPQQWGEFISHLSVLDLIFNCGPDSLAIIKEGIG